MSESVSLADVERLCWRLSGWQVEQRDVDALLAVVQAYARGAGHGALSLGLEGGAGAAEPPQEALGEPAATGEPSTAPRQPQTGTDGPGIEGAYVLTVTRVDRPQPGRRTDTAGGKRTCRKCKKRAPLEEFNKDAHSPGGRKTACKSCENERKRTARRIQRAAERVTGQKGAA